MKMNTDLSPENENFIDHAVATGLFQDRGKALNAAIDLLKRREGLIRDVNSGIDQLERGQGVPFDIDAIMAKIDERLGESGK
jgi:Arc/MetJ-type ribon-helix-helix transcriptional regulator